MVCRVRSLSGRQSLSGGEPGGILPARGKIVEGCPCRSPILMQGGHVDEIHQGFRTVVAERGGFGRNRRGGG